MVDYLINATLIVILIVWLSAVLPMLWGKFPADEPGDGA